MVSTQRHNQEEFASGDEIYLHKSDLTPIWIINAKNAARSAEYGAVNEVSSMFTAEAPVVDTLETQRDSDMKIIQFSTGRSNWQRDQELDGDAAFWRAA